MKKVVLAYSGGLDTSVAIKWLQEKYGYEVIALALDVGEGKDLDFVRDKAFQVGAKKCYVVDGQHEFAQNFIAPALKANVLYEGVYPLSAALSRPLICQKLVQVAEAEGAEAVAHGCTGKGNDQVRFDVSIAALQPELKVIAPVREWPMSREEEIDYARQRNITVPVGKKNPFSIDENLWGRSIECGVIEDPWTEAPDEAWEWTKSPLAAPAEPHYVEITFAKGVPVALDGKPYDLVSLVKTLNRVGGEHAVGRIDHVENRLVGIKSRELYECPAAMILIKAHQDLEKLTMPRELAQFKPLMEQKYAELIYGGLWFSPLKQALDAFIDRTQAVVSGVVRMKLYRGNCQAVGRKSTYSLYDLKLATYAKDDAFDHAAAKGFIDIWGLPTKVYARVQRNTNAMPEKPQPVAGD